MKLGLHSATAGDLLGTPARAAAMGAEVLQIFISNPRGWNVTTCPPEQGEAFQAACREAGISDVFAHMIYLVSYGSPDDEMRRKTVKAMQATLAGADILGIRGVVTHLGSHKGQGLDQALMRIRDSLMQVLEPQNEAWVILENSAGSGGNMGNSLEELEAILTACDRHPRLKICLDTAHLLGSGYDVRTPVGWNDFIEKFDSLIGLDRLACMHLNDSKADLGSKVDRHENIGDGYYGQGGMRHILTDPRLADVPGILEVPGIDGKGPDAENIRRLRELAGKA